MSYDVWLTIDTGGREPVSVWEANHTSNTAAMWRKAGCDLAELHGREATDVAPLARAAIRAILDDLVEYSKLNPANGWGSVDSCVRFLESIADACEAHPLTTFWVHR